MRWWLLLYWMVVGRKREPETDVSAFRMAHRKKDGLKEQEDQTPPTFFDIDGLPVDLMAAIFGKLSHRDAQKLRASSRQMNLIYQQFRGQMQGPQIDVFVRMERGEIKTSARLSIKMRTEAIEIPEEEREQFFRNAKITVLFRFNTNTVTAKHVATITEMFSRSHMMEVKMFVEMLTPELRDLMNTLNGGFNQVIVNKYSQAVVAVNNMRYLSVRDQLTLDELRSLLIPNLNLYNLNVTVPQSAHPFLRTCIEQWKRRERRIAGWTLTSSPTLFEIYGEYSRVDWRERLFHRGNGERLRQIWRSDEHKTLLMLA